MAGQGKKLAKLAGIMREREVARRKESFLVKDRKSKVAVAKKAAKRGGPILAGRLDNVPLVVGARVKLTGLNTQGFLNGSEGVITKVLDGGLDGTQYYNLALDADGGTA